MNDKLRGIIRLTKDELGKDPSSILFGQLEDGLLDKGEDNGSAIRPYYDFLRECNGARCGSIDLWSDELLSGIQFRVTDMPGGADKWLCIGQILYEPVVMNKADGMVYRFYQGAETEGPADCFGILDEFLIEYVFGTRYADIIPNADDEEWYQLIKKLKE